MFVKTCSTVSTKGYIFLCMNHTLIKWKNVLKFEIYFKWRAIGPADGLNCKGQSQWLIPQLKQNTFTDFWILFPSKVAPNSPPFRLYAKSHNSVPLNRL